jgi:hypothetical protein
VSAAEFTNRNYWGGRPVAHWIADAVPRGRVVVTGVVYSTDVTKTHGSPSYLCLLDDGTADIGLLFLGQRHVAGMVVGTRCTVEGTAQMDGGRLVLWNPVYRIEPADG